MLKHLINNIIMHKSKQISVSVKTFFFFLLLFSISGASTYYVNVNGSDSNSGLTEKSAWKTINYASGLAQPGDTVFIKAGIYSDDKLTVAHTGYAESPIVFQGYQNIPGDNPTLDYQPGDSLDSTLMPLMNGLDRTSGRAIVASYRNYIEIRNIQLTNYELGVYIPNSNHVLIENVIAAELGDIDDSYSGVGFKIYKGGSNIFKNCIVMNAAAEGIGIVSSDNNLLENCKSYCNDTTNVNSGTDYYLYIYGNYNTVRDCYIERIGNLEHVGHGMTVKGFGEHNLFENCVARNFKGGGFVVRHRRVKYNVFKNCTAYGATGFLIRDGASYNNFYDCKAIDCYGAVRFEDTDEDDGTQYAGRYNNFYNCLFENSFVAIDFYSYDRNSDANNNRFINCVVSGGQYLFNTDRTNYDNEMINSIVYNVSQYRIGTYDLDFNFRNTDFRNNGFPLPSGDNIYNFNPVFADAAQGDYRLAGGSPCIDAGVTDTVGLNLPDSDAYGNTRVADGNHSGTAVVDLGMFEYDGISQPPAYIGEHFVSTDGNDSNDGVTEESAWKTIAHAAQIARAGDIVYIKAGDYRNEQITFANSGTKDFPIIFEGYQSTPGDNPKINFQVGSELDSTLMPLLDGGDRSNGIAFYITTQHYIEIKNIQISNYEVGVILSYSKDSGHNSLTNVIAKDLGDINDSYSGVAFKCYLGNKNSLTNCLAYNAAAEGISIESSDSNTIKGCSVICDDATNLNSGTDYYIYIGGSNNHITDCYIERVGDLQHGGHGIGVKGNGEKNVFENCKAVNLSGGGFYVRHRGAKYNKFIGCKSFQGAGFMIRDGASYNKFINCHADSCYESVVFLDTAEDDGTQFAGRYNDFYNCLFENSNYVINFCKYDRNSDANNNRFINCVFDKGRYLFRPLRTNYNNEMINCIISNMAQYKSEESGEYAINFQFSYSAFWNNGFIAPQGSGVFSENPLFVDAAMGNYHLMENSPCIDAGTPDTSGLGLPEWDADGRKRIADGTSGGKEIVDMGIYEYPDSMDRLDFSLNFNSNDNVSDQFVVADGFSDIGDDFTLELWFKIASTPKSGEEYHLISFWDDVQDIQTQLYINSDALISTNGSLGAAGIIGKSAININRWYHLAYVRTDTSVFIYLNGQLEAAKENGSDGGAYRYLVLGRFRGYEDRFDFSAFKGDMDEVRVWNYARSISQIRADKDGVLRGNEKGLTAYYNFNEGQGVVLNDKSGNGHIGNMYNMSDNNWVNGVFTPVGIFNEVVHIADKIDLAQNYPNPFNPQTKIEFTLPVTGLVNLSVYNILGQKVAELVNAVMERGKHSVPFDASNFASGVYIYKIKEKNLFGVKKMILLR